MALAIDASTPAIATQTNGSTATVDSPSFTPPANALLLIRWSANSEDPVNPSAPTITDSLGTHLTYHLLDWQSRADSPTVSGQTATWWAIAGASPPAMTITVTNQASPGFRHAALHVTVLTGHDPANPIGAHGKAGSASAGSIAQSYTAQATGGWGFLVACDWQDLGVPTIGTGCTFTDGGGAEITGQIAYAFARRTTADDSNGSNNTLNITLAGTSADVSWGWAEVLPLPSGATSTAPDQQLPLDLVLDLIAQQQWAGDNGFVPPGTLAPIVIGPPFGWPVIPKPSLTFSYPLGNPAVPTPQALVVTPPHRWTPPTSPVLINPPDQPGAPAPLVITPAWTPVYMPPVTITASQPLGNPAVGTGSAQVITPPPWRITTQALLFGPGAPAAALSTTTTGPLLVTPTFTWPLIPKAYLSTNYPLGNPAMPTPQPVVPTPPPWRISTQPQLFGPGAQPTTATTNGPIVVAPVFAWPATPRTYLSANYPLGNPAVRSPQPIIVSTPWRTLVPGALLFASSANIAQTQVPQHTFDGGTGTTLMDDGTSRTTTGSLDQRITGPDTTGPTAATSTDNRTIQSGGIA